MHEEKPPHGTLLVLLRVVEFQPVLASVYRASYREKYVWFLESASPDQKRRTLENTRVCSWSLLDLRRIFVGGPNGPGG